MRVVILTGHFPFQKRRGSILWVSQHLQSIGWHVTHVTVGYSWLSVLKQDPRLKALGYVPKRGTVKQSKNLTTIYGLSPVHPIKTGHHLVDLALAASRSLFKAYWQPKLRPPLKNADLVICESGAPILLAPLLSKYAARAARIYRVNDDIRLLNAPDYLSKAEQDHQHHFTRISSANPRLTKRFTHENITLDPMGIPRLQLKDRPPSPYSSDKGQFIAVCAGTTQLDQDAITWVAKNRPNWQVHILGRTKRNPSQTLPNLNYRGELNFNEMLSFIAHADIGLAPYIDRPGIEYQTTNSNRILLYRHYGLPILAPNRLCDPERPSIVGYSDPNALGRCETMPRQPEVIQDWSALAAALAQNGEIVPPTEVACSPAMLV